MIHLRNNKRIHEAVLLDIDPGMIKLEECKETDFDQLIGSESS